MKKIKYITFLLLIAILTLHCTSCADSKEKAQKAKDTFASFENSDRFVFINGKELHVGNRVTLIPDIIYNGEKCNLIYPDTDGMYVYSAESHMDTSIDLLYVKYETLEITPIKALTLPSHIITANFINDIFYFRVIDPNDKNSDQIYFLYDMKTDQTSIADTDDLREYVEQSGREEKHYYNLERFSLEEISASPFNNVSNRKFYVTDNRTGTTKLLDRSLLNTCEEGKAILSLDKDNVVLLTYCGFEKDGYLYLLFLYHPNDIFGVPAHYFIMKYDFDNECLDYYTSVFSDKDYEALRYIFIL